MAEKKNLTKLSKVELVEMLQRQEKMLQNRKFINSLPDKGQKIHVLVKKLKEMITKRERTDDLSSRFQQISLSQKLQSKEGQRTELDSDDDDDDDTSRDINMDDKHVDFVAAISTTIQKSPEQTERATSSAISSVDKKQKSDKWAYDSAVSYERQPKFEKAEVIPIEESIRIQQRQKKEYEALRAKQAIERLMQQRNPASSQSLSSFKFTSQEAKNRYRDTVKDDEYQDDDEHSESKDIQKLEESDED